MRHILMVRHDGVPHATVIPPPRAELVSWIAVALVMNALYVYGSFVSRADLFGIDELRWVGPARYALCAGVVLMAALALGSTTARVPVDHPAVAAVTAALSFPVFFLLRTNFLNSDGNMLAPKIETGVSLVGAHLTHDELLELFLHSRVWYYTHRWWGWSVVLSYQVVSCLAGAVFLYGVIRLARRVSPGAPWLFVAGALAGGYMQLFFGDIENYTVTAALAIFYVLAACRFLAGEVGVWLPTVVLAVATCFHLEAGWLMPSLLYLFAKSRDRRGDLREVRTSAALGAAILAATLVYFHFHGLPLRQFVSSHAGHALRMNGVFAVGVPLHYYVEQLNLLLLLCPAVGMLLPLAVWHRHDRDEPTTFLAVSAGSLLLFQAIWKAQLGVYEDWNLYAIGGMLTSLYIWRGVSAAARTPLLRMTAIALAASGGLHTYAWIIANHRYGR